MRASSCPVDDAIFLDLVEEESSCTVDPETLQHMASCPDCRGRLEELRRLHSRLLDVGRDAARPIPDTIGPYRVVRLIGEGGMGIVYEAEQREPLRRVALKVVHPLRLQDTKQLSVFQREIQVLGSLSHPSIARIYDAGRTEEGQGYFAMELIEGRQLVHFCERSALSVSGRLRLLAAICRAIHYAHERGIIHRDLKPANVLVDGEGMPHILDFGLARMSRMDGDLAVTLSAHPSPMGTLPYMSPEQVLGKSEQVDLRSDVYSLGVVLYELLTNSFPYDVSGTLPDAMRTILEQEARDPSTLDASVGGELSAVCLKALAKDRERRYPTAAALADEIERYLAGEAVRARPPSAGYKLRVFARRNRALVAGALVALLALGSGIAMGLLSGSPGESRNGSSSSGIAPSGSPLLRRVWEIRDQWGGSGRVSQDGRWIAYVDWTSGNVGIRDLEAGVNTALTRNKAFADTGGWTESAACSPDADRVAYSWRVRPQGSHELRVIGREHGSPRVLLRSEAHILTLDWSNDGRSILVLERGEHEDSLVIVDSEGTPERRVKSWPRSGHGSGLVPRSGIYNVRAGFSPDGKYIAVSASEEDDPELHDVFAISLDDGIETPLVRHAADDRFVAFTPDGRGVLFTSNRTSNRQSLWWIGVPDGAALPVDLDLQTDPIGFSANGTLYYYVDTSHWDVHVVELDESGLGFAGTPETVSSQHVAAARACDWSPDGRHLVMEVSPEQTSSYPGWNLSVCTLEDGSERMVPLSEPIFGHTTDPRWSPDGRSLILESERRVLSVDISSGETRVLHQEKWEKRLKPQWSRDGLGFYFLTPTGVSYKHISNSLEANQVFRGKAQAFDLSPDGDSLAVACRRFVVIAPLAGGPPREVASLGSPPLDIRWYQSGQHLLCVTLAGKMHRIEPSTGRIDELGAPIKGIRAAVPSPNGRHLSLQVYKGGSELWAARDFLARTLK